MVSNFLYVGLWVRPASVEMLSVLWVCGYIFILWHVKSDSFDFPVSSAEEGVVQLLEGLSGRLLDSLKEVLVERYKLTLGKELGKGQFMIPHQL